MLDYDSIDWSRWFRLDTESPSGLSWVITRYSWNGNKLEIWDGKPAGTLKDVRNKENKAWEVVVQTGEFDRHHFKIHRIIKCMLGEKVNGFVIDHINGDSSDNTYSNLRATTQTINSRNRNLHASSRFGITGVTLIDDKKGNLYFSSNYSTDGKKYTKCFSIKKLGIMEAYAKAVSFRLQKLDDLNKQGFGYTNRHMKGN